MIQAYSINVHVQAYADDLASYANDFNDIYCFDQHDPLPDIQIIAFEAQVKTLISSFLPYKVVDSKLRQLWHAPSIKVVWVGLAQRSAHTFTPIDDLNNRPPIIEPVPLQLDHDRIISRRLEALNVCYKTLLRYLKAWFAIVSSNDEFDVYPRGFNANELNSLMHDFLPNDFESKMEKLQDAYTKDKLETTHFHHTYKRSSESLDYPIVHEYWSKTTTYDEQQWTAFFKKLGKFRRIIPFLTEVHYELQVGLLNNRFFSTVLCTLLISLFQVGSIIHYLIAEWFQFYGIKSLVGRIANGLGRF
ncbi:unnamed protein product [Ambrosiozyma monospora]|uniref:Unnamed protein product n=1 Tax=Ambrosiozyma monospora TaxID=43982 RepID=A0ACB5T277_AMBMO|nr:unnamed protein product [Ambrosiozyma monospora]